jgi:hypothetical protein
MGNALIWPAFDKFSPDASPVSDAPVSDVRVSNVLVSDAPPVSDALVSDALVSGAGPVSNAISDVNVVSGASADSDQCSPPLAADIPEERDQEQSAVVLNEPDEDPSPSLAVSTEKVVVAEVMIDATAEPSPKKAKQQSSPPPKEKDALSPVVRQTRSRTGRQLKPNSRYAQ